MEHKILDIQLETILTGHQNPIFTLEQPDDLDVLYTGGNDKGVVEWDLKNKKFKRIVGKVGASIYKLLAIPGTAWLAIGLRSGQVLLVDTENQSLGAQWATDSGAIFDIKYLAEKKEIIAIGEEGYAYVWSLESKALLYRFKIAETTSRIMALSDDQKLLAFGDKTGQIHLHDAVDFRSLAKQQIHEMPVTSLTFNHGQLISGARDAKLARLDPQNLNVIQKIVPHLFTVYGIANSPDQQHIATASRDKGLKIWNAEDFKLIKNISRDRGYDSHHLSINNLLWKEDRIFTVSDDKTVRIWKVVFD